MQTRSSYKIILHINLFLRVKFYSSSFTLHLELESRYGFKDQSIVSHKELIKVENESNNEPKWK